MVFDYIISELLESQLIVYAHGRREYMYLLLLRKHFIKGYGLVQCFHGLLKVLAFTNKLGLLCVLSVDQAFCES